MRRYEVTPSLQKTLNKLLKRDKLLYERLLKKIEDIINCENVEHYKNLSYDLKDKKRVHIGPLSLFSSL